MKPLLVALVLCSGLLSLQAREPLDSSLPDRIMVGVEPISAVQFSLWKEDPVMYAGKYSGKIAGDTTVTLEVTVAGGITDNPRVTVSGTYREEPIGVAPIVVTFQDAFFHKGKPTVLDAGAFRVDFVRHGETNGVVIAGAFIARESVTP